VYVLSLLTILVNYNFPTLALSSAKKLEAREAAIAKPAGTGPPNQRATQRLLAQMLQTKRENMVRIKAHCLLMASLDYDPHLYFFSSGTAAANGPVKLQARKRI
jgi:hypothetical protein